MNERYGFSVFIICPFPFPIHLCLFAIEIVRPAVRLCFRFAKNISVRKSLLAYFFYAQRNYSIFKIFATVKNSSAETSFRQPPAALRAFLFKIFQNRFRIFTFGIARTRQKSSVATVANQHLAPAFFANFIAFDNRLILRSCIFAEFSHRRRKRKERPAFGRGRGLYMFSSREIRRNEQ